MAQKRFLYLRKITLWILACTLFFSATPVSAEGETEQEIPPAAFELYIAPHATSAVCGSFSVGDTVTVLDTVNPNWSRVRLADSTVIGILFHLLRESLYLNLVIQRYSVS